MPTGKIDQIDGDIAAASDSSTLAPVSDGETESAVRIKP